MKLLRTFRGIDKREFEVPERDLDAFRAEVPDAVEVMEFRGPDQRAFAVPESDLDAFRAEVPDAAPVKRARTRDGRVVDGPELEQAAAEEFDTLSRDLNHERGKWRILRGNQNRRRAKLEQDLDAHLRAFGAELGIPEQWARPDDPAAALPDGIPRMPAGLDMRARQQWMEDREYERMTAPRARLAADGRTVLDAATGEPAVSAQGGVAQAAPNRRIKGVQWQDEARVWRDGTGRALSPYDLDESDERARESALGFKLWMRGEEPGGLPVIPGVDPEEQRAQRARLVDAGRAQRDAYLADTLNEETARNIARLKFGRGIGAGEQFTRVVKNAGDYIPLSPVPLAKALVVNDIMKRDAAWAAWDEGGRQGPEPPRITPLEEARANQYLSDKQLQEELGRTMTAGVVEGVAHLVPYMAEMAMGGGLVGAVQKGVGKAVLSRAAGKRTAEAVGKWASKSLARRGAVWGAKTAGALAVDATVRTALNPMGFAADYVERRMAPGAVGESSEPGQLFERAYFPEERQGRVEAFKNTLGDRWVEYFSEGVGDKVTLGLGKALPGTSRIGRYVRRLGTRPVAKYLKKAGFAGGPMEFLEERVGGGMREALGVDLTPEQKAAGLGERLSRGLIPGEEEGLIEAAVLMVPMLGAGALNTVMERRQLGRLREFRDAERAERRAMNSALAAAGIDAGEFAARTWRTAHGGRSVQATAADVEQIEALAIGTLRKYGEPAAVRPQDVGEADRRLLSGLVRARRTALDALDLHAARQAAGEVDNAEAQRRGEETAAGGGAQPGEPWVTMDASGELVDVAPGTDGAVPVSQVIAEFEAPDDPGDGGQAGGIEGTEESLVLDDGRMFAPDEIVPPGSYSIGGQTVSTAAPMPAQDLMAGLRPETPAARSSRLLAAGGDTAAVDQVLATGSTDAVRAAAPGAGITVGSGQAAVGSGQAAVGSGQAAVGSGEEASATPEEAAAGGALVPPPGRGGQEAGADEARALSMRRNYAAQVARLAAMTQQQRLAELKKTARGDVMSEEKFIVAMARGGGVSPNSVAKSLVRLGLDRGSAARLVEREYGRGSVTAFRPPSRSKRLFKVSFEDPTLAAVQKLGGFKASEKDEWHGLPEELINRSGGGITLEEYLHNQRDDLDVRQGADNARQEADERDAGDFVERLRRLADGELALRRDEEEHYSEIGDWEAGEGSELAPLASIRTGAVWVERGQAWQATGESDTAIEARPITADGLGDPVYIAYEDHPNGIRIDEGSLRAPEDEAVPKAGTDEVVPKAGTHAEAAPEAAAAPAAKKKALVPPKRQAKAKPPAAAPAATGLTPKQRQLLAISARRAYKAQAAAGKIVEGESFDVWRHAWIREATGRSGLRELTQEDFGPVMDRLNALVAGAAVASGQGAAAAVPAVETSRQDAKSPSKKVLEPAKRGKSPDKHGRTLRHFTTPERAERLRTDGVFSFDNAPIHGTGALDDGPKTGRFAGRRIYLSLDDEGWGATAEFTPSGDARPVDMQNPERDMDAVERGEAESFYDYARQQWMLRPGRRDRKQLEGVDVQIDDAARVLVIDSPERLAIASEKYGALLDNDAAWDRLARDYDVVEIRNTQKHAGASKFFRAAMYDQAVVLNAAVAHVAGKQAPPAASPSDTAAVPKAGTDEVVPKAGTQAEAAPAATAVPAVEASRQGAKAPGQAEARTGKPDFMAAANRKAQELFGNSFVMIGEDQRAVVRDALAKEGIVPKKALIPPKRQAKPKAPAAEQAAQATPDVASPAPASPAGSAAAAKMSPEQRARLEAIKRKLQGHIDDGTLREETEPYYAGRRLVPPARSVVREGGRISGEALQVGLDLAALYAETGLTQYADFAGAVRRDLPLDMWETLKPHLPAFWNHAGAENDSLEEITRKEAAAVHARIEAAGGSSAVERNPSDLYEAADEVAARALLGAAGDGKWPVAVVIGGEVKGIARVEQWQRMSDDSHPRYGFHLLSWHGNIPRGSNAEMLWRLRPATQADIDVLAKRYKGLPSGVRIGTDGAPVVAAGPQAGTPVEVPKTGTPADAAPGVQAAEATPPELMTPEEYAASVRTEAEKYAQNQPEPVYRLDAELNQGRILRRAVDARKPISAAAWELVQSRQRPNETRELFISAFGWDLPLGYVREGDRYVFKPVFVARRAGSASSDWIVLDPGGDMVRGARFSGKKAQAEAEARARVLTEDATDLFSGGQSAMGGEPSANAEGADGDSVSRHLGSKSLVAAKRGESPITDFGEKIGGARKDYAARLQDAKQADIATQPLAKVWPEPDYADMVKAGEDPLVVGFIRAMRDEIPARPRQAYKLSRYVERVKTLRDMAEKLLSGEIDKAQLLDVISRPSFKLLKIEVLGRAELYAEIGHERSLKGVTFRQHNFSFYKGEKNVAKWMIEKKGVTTAMSNMPRELGVGDTREQALADFKAKLADAPAADEKRTEFSVYSYKDQTKKPGFVVGKKMATGYADLFTFPTAAEARAFLREHRDEVEARFEAFRKIGSERRTTNAPRIGADHRQGRAVTPEMFQEAFGFRGVEFGNYVEQGRRQADLNDAYDALMDLAGILNIPTRALSLNGELGLAFGARGHGGTDAPAAHYESGKVVINLTKKRGPGSLAHEWWHALDNYFSRQGGDTGGMQTETSPRMATAVRAEVRQAFAAVAQVARESGLLERSRQLDMRRSSPYWSKTHEMTARAFENYIVERLAAKQASNDYLANIADISEFAHAMLGAFLEDGKTAAELYPYLTESEVKPFTDAFDTLFAGLQTVEGADGRIMLREEAAPYGQAKDASADDDFIEIYREAHDEAIEDFVREFRSSAKGQVASWPVVPAGRLKKIWTDHARMGFVRDEAGMDGIARKMIELVARLEAATEILGHTPIDARAELLESMGYEFTDKEWDRFQDFLTAPSGQWRLSDYGMKPLQGLARELVAAKSAEEQLVIVDRMLNVTHQRGDMAENFVEGGKETLGWLANQGGSLYETAAEYGQDAGADGPDGPANPWPENFGKVMLMSSGPRVRNHRDHAAAKAGDAEAAVRLVADLGKPAKLRAFAAAHPGAIVVSVHGEEASGRNALPESYARYIGTVTGLEVDTGIVMANRVGHTGAGHWHRLAVRPEFDGAVQAGREYLVVDDLVRDGSTLSELRRYIEARGGRVVGVSTLGHAMFADTIALTDKTRVALEQRYGLQSLRDFLKEQGLYGGEHRALTEGEGRTLLSAGTLDAAGDRIAEARQAAGLGSGRGVAAQAPARPGAQEGLTDEAPTLQDAGAARADQADGLGALPAGGTAGGQGPGGAADAPGGLPGESGAGSVYPKTATGSSLEAWRLPDGRGVARPGASAVPAALRSKAEASVRAHYPEGSPEADAAVRETLGQMELAFGAPDTPYAEPAPAPRSLVPDALRLRRARREREKALREQERVWEARREQMRRALTHWSPEALADLLGDNPDAGVSFLGPHADRERMHLVKGGGEDALWDEGSVLVLDAGSDVVVRSPRDVARLMLPLRSPEFESFKVIALDKEGRVLGARVVSTGLLDSCPANARTTMGWIPDGTTGVIVAHNHPSGDPSPSPDDYQVSELLVRLGEIIGVPVLDHVITNGSYVSQRGGGRVDFDGADPYGGAGDSTGRITDRLAEWEVVAHDKRPPFTRASHVATAFARLRRAALAHGGQIAHVLLVDTRSRLVAVERIDAAGLSPDQFAARIAGAGLRHRAAGRVFLDFSFADVRVARLNRAAESAVKAAGMELLDSFDCLYQSKREMGGGGGWGEVVAGPAQTAAEGAVAEDVVPYDYDARQRYAPTPPERLTDAQLSGHAAIEYRRSAAAWRARSGQAASLVSTFIPGPVRVELSAEQARAVARAGEMFDALARRSNRFAEDLIPHFDATPPGTPRPGEVVRRTFRPSTEPMYNVRFLEFLDRVDPALSEMLAARAFDEPLPQRPGSLAMARDSLDPDDIASTLRGRVNVHEGGVEARGASATEDRAPYGGRRLVPPPRSEVREFAGVLARNAPDTSRAEAMEEGGADREAVWRETGFWRGLDGKWRYELDTSRRMLKPGALARVEEAPQPLAAVIDHPELFAAYPHMRSIDVELRVAPGPPQAQYDDWIGRIKLSGPRDGDWGRVLAHEVQHAIQEREVFARGGDMTADSIIEPLVEERRRLNRELAEMAKSGRYDSPEYRAKKARRDAIIDQEWEIENPDNARGAYDGYRRLAGEAEARLAERRLGMTSAERAAEPPWETLEKMLRGEGLLKDGQRIEDVLIRPRASVAEEAAQYGGERSAVTPEQDAAYMRAVEAGDMATAQRMVDAAAKAAGYTPKDMFHATLSDWTTYDLNAKTLATTEYKTTRGISLAPNKDTALNFIGLPILKLGLNWKDARVKRLYAKTQRTFDVALASKAEKEAFAAEIVRQLGEEPYPDGAFKKNGWWMRHHTDGRDWATLLQQTINGLEGGSNHYLHVEQPAVLRALGYDSVITRESPGDADGNLFLLDPHQIKSADPVTRDDAGRVIPLSERFDPDRDDILHEAPAAYSVRESGVPAVTPEQDAAYMKAVESGDRETAQRMVDEAYGRIYNVEMNHAVSTLPHIGKIYRGAERFGDIADDFEGGANWTTNRDYAKQYARDNRNDGVVREAYLKPGRYVDFRAFGETLDKPSLVSFLEFSGVDLGAKLQSWLYRTGDPQSLRDAIVDDDIKTLGDLEEFVLRGAGHIIKQAGFDGFVVGEGGDVNDPTFVVFSENSLSADPITRDDAGRVIPLSERFDPERDDILHEAPAAYSVRESGVPYGSGSVPPAADGAPDWDAFADLAQRAADFDRLAGRRVEITRAIERNRMTRLAREMQRLKRASARAQADKAAGKAAGLDAARKTYETIAGHRADDAATIGDLMREALAIGRRRGRESRTALDLTRMLREALNARVKRLMGSQLPMPKDWRAINAAVNRRMLAQLDQIETSIQASAPGRRGSAAAAELRRLFWLDKAQWTALEAETRMGAVGSFTLLQSARKAIERDLRAYYRAEMTTLFGGRTVERRLPSGQTITVKSQGLARRGLRRMVPDQRQAMETLIEGIDFANLKDLPLDAMRAHVDRAREILAEDALAKEAIAAGHKVRREEAAEAAAAEIEAARPELDQAATSDPRKGGLLQRLGWFTASQRRRALLLAGGNESGATGTVLWSNLLDANERQLTLESTDLRALDDKLAELGFTRDGLLDLSYQPREIVLADGRTLLMTRGEMMTLYGMTLDEDARAKLVRNGWRPARWRHDAGRTIRGQGEDYDARLAASEAIIGGVVAQLTPAEKSLVEWMVVDQSREWARRGNETSRRMTGAELFEDKPHITLAGSVDRQAVVPDVDSAEFARGAHMVDRMGLTKERQAHSHALFVRDILSVYRQQARDMSVFTAWSLPFRDAMTLLSRGPALSAIVTRWGTDAVKTMKETLGYATYQKGHTDNWKGGQKWLYGRERAAAGFILGLRASSAMLNRYGGALTMAAALDAEGRGRSGAAARFLARVFRPQAGLARLGVRERKAAYDALMADGFLYDRWHRSPYRVFAQMASQRMEIEESQRALKSARSLARRDAWQRFQQWALSFMTKAEIGNGVDMYLTLRSGGMSQADAVRQVSRLTRQTQNPSSPLEETTQYTDISSSGLGFLLPFQGQPSVLWDWVKAEHIKSRRSGEWRGFRSALNGALAATLFSVALRLLVRRAAKGLMDGDDDDDKELTGEVRNTILDLAGELSGAVMPGTESAFQQLLRPILAISGDSGAMQYSPRGEGLLGQIGVSGAVIGRGLYRTWQGKEWSEEQVEQLIMDMHRLVGMTTGLPTGGIEQAARVGLGLAGDPLGREPPESPGPVRRRGLVPPARRRQ